MMPIYKSFTKSWLIIGFKNVRYIYIYIYIYSQKAFIFVVAFTLTKKHLDI